MAIFWITDSNLGVFTEGQVFVDSPIVLQYLASEFATVTLQDGNLPIDLAWTADSGYILITGIISFGSIPETYQFTFRITELDGSYLDKEFSMNVTSSPVPVWLAPSNLGSFAENYSFNLNPLVIEYSSLLGSKVFILNGALPSGLTWRAANNTITITGESDNISSDLQASWTYRIVNPNGTIADRTFTLTITSLSIRPDWTGQNQMLGYIGIQQTAHFTVKATLPGTTPPTYSLVSGILDGMMINEYTGLITYSAPPFNMDTVIPVTVRASSATSYADLDCEITVLIIPHLPVWVTPPDLIKVPQKEYLEYPLVAFDPNPQSKIVYSLIQADQDFPFALDSDGLLYGVAPTVESNRLFVITVRATTTVGVVDQVFTFEITQVNTLGLLVWKNDISEILNIPDGRRAVFDVSAKSTRTNSVKHGIIGGQLPPGLLLDKMQGCLIGYVDYHMRSKDYWFDLWATDEVDTIVKTIHVRVIPTLGYQFMDISIPLYGDLHNQWRENNREVFNNSNMIVNVSVESNVVSNPELSLIRGLYSIFTDPKQLLSEVKPSLQQMDLVMGPQLHTTVDSNGSQLFYRSVIDPQDGAGFIAAHSGLPPTIRPNSLQGMRTAFIKTCGFANSGGGTGTTAIVIVEPENGSITGIYIVNSGDGYVNHPAIKINGIGTGASAYTMAKITRMVVVDPGSDWQIGEQFTLDFGEYDSPAKMVVTDVFPGGGLKEVAFVVEMNKEVTGCYYLVPAGKILIRNTAGKLSGVRFELGVDEIRLTNNGHGYDNTTTVDFSGGEQLAPWQDRWNPVLPVALVNQSYSNLVVNNTQFNVTNPLDGEIWQVGYLFMDIQGAYWQGTTVFNEDFVSWDGNTTRFEETLTPVETIFDKNNQTYDVMDTTFDIGPPVHRDARDNWGQTLIDEGTTAFEFYATIFDATSPPKNSSTLVRQLVRLPTQYILMGNEPPPPPL